ncbi:hypothetical protein Cgig2_030168 [Carnegiea gigantea]|uniref:Trafficking protein particle complex subunit n=1 Tax=Carnegiea gigantea TaxID=171969 RepID=A0A9Q1KAC4_9CARY|nr:hypothetical protein Cgig2_030168 [Carnegiea gigantea]
MAAIYSLYIINKSGGLIFYKDYGSAGRMDTNDTLRLASLWHSMHAISQQLSPVSGCTGIELLEADTFDLHCFQALTVVKLVIEAYPKGPSTGGAAVGSKLPWFSSCSAFREAPESICILCAVRFNGTKFFVVCEPGTPHMENLLKHIYELYTDYVLKNPFYEMEMPIRCELFDINLAQAVQKDRVTLLGR